MSWNNNPSAVTLLSTELNGLTNDSRVITAAIDNSIDLEQFADFELSIATQPSTRDPNAAIEIYIIPSIDGINYPEYATVDPSVNMKVGSFVFSENDDAEIDTILNILIPPGKFKILLKNITGQALAESGNVLKYRIYS